MCRSRNRSADRDMRQRREVGQRAAVLRQRRGERPVRQACAGLDASTVAGTVDMGEVLGRDQRPRRVANVAERVTGSNRPRVLSRDDGSTNLVEGSRTDDDIRAVSAITGPVSYRQEPLLRL